MGHPLVAVGDAVFEAIGLSPRGFDRRSEANWPGEEVFDDGPFYQPTGMGERVIMLLAEARPHAMGGLDVIEVLRGHLERQEVVPFLRLGPDLVASVGEDVFVRSLGHVEERIAPDGVGYWHGVEVELVIVGPAWDR